MTHEELVEKVAEALLIEVLGQLSHYESRALARVAVKITGEACSDLCVSKVPHYSTNELIDDTMGGNHSGAVYAVAIQSLTQRKET